MKTYNSLTVVMFLLLMSSIPISAQSKKYSDDVERNIMQVENHLAGWAKTGTDDTWTLADRMKKYNINGVSIAVIHNSKIEWARGYGYADVAENRPVTEKTLFQAASISKSLNAVGVLRLVQEKKLDLNTDINKYLVTWKFPYNEKSNNKIITLTNLLSHTAGLTIPGFPGYARGDSIPDLSQILDGKRPANTEPVRSTEEPGTRVNYSGGGITVSQLILMDVTDEPYDVFMQKNVLDPLGMISSSYTQPPPAENEYLLATGYRGDGTEIPGKFHIYPEQAAAGLWTNPTDLCKYIIETQLAWKGQSSKVLNQKMTVLRLTPVMEDAALGVFVNSRVTGSYKYFNHNGGNEGFQCTYVGCRDSGDGVAIMTNSDNGSRIYEEILNSVATVYNWKDYYLPETEAVIDVKGSVLDKYTGKYDVSGNVISIQRSGDGLIANPRGDILWKVYFTSDSDFFVREIRGLMRFTSGSDKKVKGFYSDGRLSKKID
jgi:CubicO group peptidase (beta-lactamase class C family)